MSHSRVEAYWLAMTPLQAEELLLGIRVASQPYVDEAQQRKWRGTLIADGKKFLEPERVIGVKEFIEGFNGRKNNS